MSWNERTTSGANSNLVLLPDRLKRLLRGRPLDPSEENQVIPPIEFNGQRFFEQRTGQDPRAFQGQSQPIISQPAPQEPIRPQPDAPTLPVMPVDYSPQAIVPDPASVRPRTATLPILPDRGADDAVRNTATKEYGYPEDADLPILPYRPSSAVLAPDKTQNPDYAPQMIATRPKATDPYGQAVERDLAIRDALANPSQLPKAHGWKRLLPVLVRAGQGMAATGNLAGAAGGAVEGGIESAVDPRSATKIQYQRKLGQADENLAGMEAIRGRQIKQAEEAERIATSRSARAKTDAETLNTLDLPVRDRLKTQANLDRDNRMRAETERHNKALESNQGATRADAKARAAETERHNKEVEKNARDMIQATAGRSGQARVQGEQWRRWNAEKGIVEKRNQDSQKEWQDARREAEHFNADKNKLDQLGAERNSLNGRQDRSDADERRLAQLDEQLPKEIQRLTRETERLKGNRHLTLNGEERFEVNERPEPEAYPDLPVGDVGGGQAVAPQGRISRQNFGRFRDQNPQFKGKTDAEIESVLRGQGYEIY